MISQMNKKAGVNGEQARQTIVTASIRIERDLGNLDGVLGTVEVPDPKNLQLLHVIVRPPDGIWKGGEFRFKLLFPDSYPYEPPTARYMGPTRLWHPNIEGEADKSDWGVCLNILNDEWSPVLGVRDVVFGLGILFLNPCIDDPLPGVAREAAQLLHDNPDAFAKKAQAWMRGHYAD